LSAEQPGGTTQLAKPLSRAPELRAQSKLLTGGAHQEITQIPRTLATVEGEPQECVMALARGVPTAARFPETKAGTVRRVSQCGIAVPGIHDD